jgi:hypothetical protein
MTSGRTPAGPQLFLPTTAGRSCSCAARSSARAPSAPIPWTAVRGVSTEAADDWLTPDQATNLLKKPRQWLIRHHRELPFARKVSRKTILFNRTGAVRWLETRPR